MAHRSSPRKNLRLCAPIEIVLAKGTLSVAVVVQLWRLVLVSKTAVWLAPPYAIARIWPGAVCVAESHAVQRVRTPYLKLLSADAAAWGNVMHYWRTTDFIKRAVPYINALDFRRTDSGHDWANSSPPPIRR